MEQADLNYGQSTGLGAASKPLGMGRSSMTNKGQASSKPMMGGIGSGGGLGM